MGNLDPDEFSGGGDCFFRCRCESDHVTKQPAIRIQGATAQTVAPGLVHQGIFRTWSQLWYGTDILNTTFLQPQPGAAIILRYLLIFGAVALGLLYIGAPSIVVMLTSLSVVLFLMAFSSGSIEGLFWNRMQKTGGGILPELRQRHAQAPSGAQISFVGHSLGGALATLAFVAYRNQHGLKTHDDVRLITFACPHVGDDDFVRYFETEHNGRYRHVVSLADPITYSPPPVLTRLLPLLGRSVFTAWGIVACRGLIRLDYLRIPVEITKAIFCLGQSEWNSAPWWKVQLDFFT
jgi:hypothetical protein